jgi:hypothetical protein
MTALYFPGNGSFSKSIVYEDAYGDRWFLENKRKKINVDLGSIKKYNYNP